MGFSAVTQGVLMILVGSLLAIAVAFAGGLVWDGWYGALDDNGMFDRYPSSSYSPQTAVTYGNMFYVAAIGIALLFWTAGILTVYRKQRYDSYYDSPGLRRY